MKTLGDKPRLKTLKSDVQVSQLWPLESPDPLSKNKARIAGLETTFYTVTAKLMYARNVDDPPDSHGDKGGDFDYHLVIADPKDTTKTMIVEFPDPDCAKGATSYRRAQIASARSAFVIDCHGAPRTGFANLSGTATITGVGFYDTPHANGRSKHGGRTAPCAAVQERQLRLDELGGRSSRLIPKQEPLPSPVGLRLLPRSGCPRSRRCVVRAPL